MKHYFIVNTQRQLFAGFQYVSYAEYVAIWRDWGHVTSMPEVEALQNLRLLGGEDKSNARIVCLE
jgi:hypothetical protein